MHPADTLPRATITDSAKRACFDTTLVQPTAPPGVEHESRARGRSGAADAPRSSPTAEDVGLELQQLAHEGQVGGDDLAPLLDEVESLVQFDALRVHQVRQADGGRAGNTCLTVDQHPTSALLHRVCKKRQNGGGNDQQKVSESTGLRFRRKDTDSAETRAIFYCYWDQSIYIKHP